MILILVILSLFSSYQTPNWDILATTELSRGYDEFLQQEVDIPKFNSEIMQLNGTELEFSGYVIPLENTTSFSYFVLSRFPYQSCFFCGAAGPETVIEVYADLSNPKMDQQITVRGIFEINDADPMHLFFKLKDAIVVDD